MSLSIHRRTGHGRALLRSTVCSKNKEKKMRVGQSVLGEFNMSYQAVFLVFQLHRAPAITL